MGRPGIVYPPELAGERECLNCDEPFTPAATGWQALYCSHACWRANNGGPGRHQTAYRPRPSAEAAPPAADPVPEILDQVAVSGPLDGGIVWPPTPPAPAASRLVVIGQEHCPRCGVDHQVYGYRGAP